MITYILLIAVAMMYNTAHAIEHHAGHDYKITEVYPGDGLSSVHLPRGSFLVSDEFDLRALDGITPITERAWIAAPAAEALNLDELFVGRSTTVSMYTVIVMTRDNFNQAAAAFRNFLLPVGLRDAYDDSDDWETRDLITREEMLADIGTFHLIKALNESRYYLVSKVDRPDGGVDYKVLIRKGYNENNNPNDPYNRREPGKSPDWGGGKFWRVDAILVGIVGAELARRLYEHLGAPDDLQPYIFNPAHGYVDQEGLTIPSPDNSATALWSLANLARERCDDGLTSILTPDCHGDLTQYILNSMRFINDGYLNGLRWVANAFGGDYQDNSEITDSRDLDNLVPDNIPVEFRLNRKLSFAGQPLLTRTSIKTGPAGNLAYQSHHNGVVGDSTANLIITAGEGETLALLVAARPGVHLSVRVTGPHFSSHNGRAAGPGRPVLIPAFATVAGDYLVNVSRYRSSGTPFVTNESDRVFNLFAYHNTDLEQELLGHSNDVAPQPLVVHNRGKSVLGYSSVIGYADEHHQPDKYSIELDELDIVNLGVEPLDGDNIVQVAIYDPLCDCMHNGTVDGDTIPYSQAEYLAVTEGTYDVYVYGAPNTRYHLTVTRDAWFSSEHRLPAAETHQTAGLHMVGRVGDAFPPTSAARGSWIDAEDIVRTDLPPHTFVTASVTREYIHENLDPDLSIFKVGQTVSVDRSYWSDRHTKIFEFYSSSGGAYDLSISSSTAGAYTLSIDTRPHQPRLAIGIDGELTYDQANSFHYQPQWSRSLSPAAWSDTTNAATVGYYRLRVSQPKTSAQ